MANQSPAQLLMQAGIKFVNGPYTVNPLRLFVGTKLMKISAALLNCKIEIVVSDPNAKVPLDGMSLKQSAKGISGKKSVHSTNQVKKL